MMAAAVLMLQVARGRRLSLHSTLSFPIIPAIGSGTLQNADSQEAAVNAALETGCRHLDTDRM